MEIRKARISELLKVHRMLWQTTLQWDTQHLSLFILKSLLQRRRHTYVCVVNSEIVGFTIALEERHGKATEWYWAILVVGEKHRRKGYGRQMSRFVESTAKGKGIRRIYCRVDESNPSLRLVESEGFQRAHTIMLEKILPSESRSSPNEHSQNQLSD